MLRELAVHQQQDESCRTVIEKLQVASPSDKLNIIYCLSPDNILFYHGKMKTQFKEYWKPAIPSKLVNKFVWHAHLLLHVGSSKVYEIVRRLVYWPGMQKDATKVVKSCVTCQKAKHPQEHLRGELQPILPTKPIQVVSVDIFGPLPKSKADTNFIFVIMDSFTKYMRLYALSKATAQVGKPEFVLSDKSTQFTSGLWQLELEDLSIVSTTTISVRHPQGNPVECRTKTIGSALRTYCNNAQ
ncbi:hypothetical protein PR048_009765 [Dryococelus australis]|uniref:RNA-directed DNA polymerase n=1 Tax=Dryococelus australis TaxID=614101 RepID=A0ABQ9I184_9NEOP|nr:hypothetical protein PR048_009765 [Dryococelus australis]